MTAKPSGCSANGMPSRFIPKKPATIVGTMPMAAQAEILRVSSFCWRSASARLTIRAFCSSWWTVRPRSTMSDRASSTSRNSGTVSGCTHAMHSVEVNRLTAADIGSRATRKSSTSRINR